MVQEETASEKQPPVMGHHNDIQNNTATCQLDSNNSTNKPTSIQPPTVEKPSLVKKDDMDNDKETIRFRDWGFKLDRLFEVAYRFYKRNESKAFHPTFDQRNHMNALILQARYGNHDSGRSPDVGVLDLVGKRRQYEWSLLKGMSKTEAMSKFICLMDELCPFFKAHAEAVKISSGIGLSNEIDMTQSNQNGRATSTANQVTHESSEQLQAIYSSLCRQTHDQFKSYAEKQFPNDISQQRYLVTTLQDQYYQQYISQMHPELKASLPGSSRESSNIIPSSIPSPTTSESSSVDKNAILNLNSDKNTLEEGDIQADISSEELNASDETNIVSLSQQPSSQSISDVQNVQSPNIEEPNYVEPVRLYQNIEPQIGPFESFPEPKPITKTPHQQKQQPQETMNPNILRSTLPQEAPTRQTANYTNQPSEVLPANGIKVTNSTDTNNVQQSKQQDQPAPRPTQPDGVINCECHEEPSSSSTSPPPPSPKELWNYSPPPMPLVPSQPLEAATIWSKRGVAEFKLSLGDDKQGGMYQVKQSSLVCIQVPTYKDGKYIYFEFATDDYDIGFGLDFVYDMNISEPQAINIYEESDDEDDDEEEDAIEEEPARDHHWHSGDQVVQRDIESGHPDGAAGTESVLSNVRHRERLAKMRKLANTIQIIPKYRRDSHEEVFVGRHRYPGTGYYLLKFDNTYSVLRSKCLYFRICYFV